MNRLLKSFNDYFEVIPADTPELLEQAYRLRFKSYCIEDKVPGFDEEKYPDGLEHDKYDEHSAQCLLKHRGIDNYVGLVRLVLNDPADPQSLFPIEEQTQQYFDENIISLQDLPRAKTAEITRLCVLNEYRLRRGELNSLFGDIDNISHEGKDRRSFPHPFLGLMVAIMQMSVQHNITHWYAGMEPKLNRRLAKFGLQLTPIGPLVEYHGQRQPYLGVIHDVMKNIYIEQRNIWGLLTDEGSIYPPPEGADIDMKKIGF